MQIEVEVRSLVPPEKFEELLGFFKKEGRYLGVDRQETWYFDCPQDLRIQQNDNFAKVWMKSGKMHDEQRQEVEIRVGRDEFPKLAELFGGLGYGVSIKWFRTRHTFEWQGVTVTLDDTRGYGLILELELMADDAGKEAALASLKEKMSGLGIAITDRAAFDEKFRWYKEHWRQAV